MSSNNLYRYTKIMTAAFVLVITLIVSGLPVSAQTTEAASSSLQAMVSAQSPDAQQTASSLPDIEQPVLHAQIPVNVEVKVEPETPVAGRSAHIRLMLKSSYPDIRIISTPEIEPDGAAVTSVGASTRTTADISGNKSFVKEFSFKVMVKRSGKILVPSITVEYEQNKAKGTLTTPAISFNALEPPKPFVSLRTVMIIVIAAVVIIILFALYRKAAEKQARKREKIENETREQMEYEKSLEDRMTQADKSMSSGDTKAAFDSCSKAFDIFFTRNCGFSFELNKMENTKHNITGLQLDLNTQQDLFRLIEAFYNARYAGLSQASDETAAIVKDSRRVLKKLEQSFSGAFKCPECGCMVSENADQCPDCGTEFEKVK